MDLVQLHYVTAVGVECKSRSSDIDVNNFVKKQCIWLIFVRLLYPYSITSYIIAWLFYFINNR